MKVLLTHAYSSTNAGDGLLVIEALGLVRAAHPSAEVTLLALDPRSFSVEGIDEVIHPLTGTTSTPSALGTLAAALKAWSRGAQLPREVRRRVDDADLVIAVGGGYLRAKTAVECLKMMLTHYPQMPATNSTKAHIYLPQSIGPFGAVTMKLVRRRLSRATQVFVRDDRSEEELLPLRSSRAPDTALFGLTEKCERSRVVTHSSGGTAIVARALLVPRARQNVYETRMKDLFSLLRAEPLAQATARGNDDTRFYDQIGFTGPYRNLSIATSNHAKNRPDVVVSVRMHGAIQSIRNGVPAIHLSYERKGWGAYEDLGISQYVHNVYDFDPSLIARQVAQLRDHPDIFWSAVRGASSGLVAARESVISSLRAPTQ
jgi:polysaccharide pyruvyl transferase WcaK-like protein